MIRLAAALLIAAWPARAASDAKFLDGLSRREFRYFQENTDAATGLALDRAPSNGSRAKGQRVASIAATGFGLSALCVGVERRWIKPKKAVERATKALRTALAMPNQHGWLYHFVDAEDGTRAWRSEVSSIDTALLIAGALTAGQCLGDPQVAWLAGMLYKGVDFPWMLNGSPNLLSMGWTPESGFIEARWDTYSEHMILDLLAIGSPTHPITAREWDAWKRPKVVAAGHTFVAGVSPLFIHQYSQAYVDFRGQCDSHGIDYFQNSVEATLAQRAYLKELAQEQTKKYSDYSDDLWGLTSSDQCGGGYVAWGAPPVQGPVDGSVVPSAPGGSLMFTPKESLAVLRNIKKRFPKAFGRYGFADSFNPLTGCVTKDSLAIDQGITLLSEADLRDGLIWKNFMRNDEIKKAMELVGFKPCGSSQ